MKKEYSHNIQKGNGVSNDALATIADLLVETGNDNNRSQKKNFNWLIVSIVIGFIALLVSIFK